MSPPDAALPDGDDAEYYDFLMTFAGAPDAEAPAAPPPPAVRPLTAEEADKYWLAHAGTRDKYLGPLQSYMNQVEQVYRNKPAQDVSKALHPLREVCRVLQAQRATAPHPTRAEYEQLARVQKYIAKLLERRKVLMMAPCIPATICQLAQQAHLSKQRMGPAPTAGTPGQMPTTRTSLPAPSPGQQALSPLPPTSSAHHGKPALFDAAQPSGRASTPVAADPVRAIVAALQRPRQGTLGARSVSVRMPPAPVGSVPAAAPTTIVLGVEPAEVDADGAPPAPSVPVVAMPAEHRATVAREVEALGRADVVVNAATGLARVVRPTGGTPATWSPVLSVGLDVDGQAWQAGVPGHPPADDLSDVVSMATVQRDVVVDAMAARVVQEGGVGGLVDAWGGAWGDVVENDSAMVA